MPTVKGFFEFEKNGKGEEDKGENFNLRPREERDGLIPEDQRTVAHQVYEVTNVLRLLKSKGAFKLDDKAYHEFWARVMQAGTAGCTSANVDTALALEALEQIRADILRRKGRAVVYNYLLTLAFWALGGVAIGAALIAIAALLPKAAGMLWGYGYVAIGAMAGAWMSAAVSRRDISFDAIQEYVDIRSEPAIRLLFVLVVALALGLLLDLEVVSISLGEAVDLADFTADSLLALALGLVAGICEKAISVQIIDRATKIISP